MMTSVSSSTTSLIISWALGSGVTPIRYTVFYLNTNTDCFNNSRAMFDVDVDMTMYRLEKLEEGSEYIIEFTVSVCEMEGIVEKIITANTTTAG